MGRVEGKVAFITGVAHGQGRSHAIRLAEEGADIIGVDRLETYPWIAYPQGSEADLEETVHLVEKLGRRIVVGRADVRDRVAVSEVLDRGIAELGHLDIVCANAGISPFGPVSWEISQQQWDDVIGVNLTGVWNTTSVAVPRMVSAGRGGSIIITSSGAGLQGLPGLADYCASKWAVIGFAKSLALEVGREMIRVNVVAPGAVATDMVLNDGLYRLFRPDLDQPTQADAAAIFSEQMSAMPVPWVESVDVSNAVLYLASDEARYVTGTVLNVDLGSAGK